MPRAALPGPGVAGECDPTSSKPLPEGAVERGEQYHLAGFTEVGEMHFLLGSDRQRDLVLALAL